MSSSENSELSSHDNSPQQNSTSSAQPSNLDQSNISFWNELCGSHLAKVIGIEDSSPSSLRKFDNWFLAYYPYIFLHIPFDELKDKDVLEVGLGYGTIAQRLAESGANYMGLDIADGPVAMAKHRINQAALKGDARQGSILAAPFDDNSFDMIVTIGCLHHTGNLQKSLDECYRMLRPGGRLMVMFYYAYSYRRWFHAPLATFHYLFRELFGYRGVVEPMHDSETWDYDHNAKGEIAPHTDFVSVKSLRAMCKRFRSFEWRRENINNERPFSRWASRRALLKTRFPQIVGLEIYATAQK